MYVRKKYSQDLDDNYGKLAEDILYDSFKASPDIYSVTKFPFGRYDVDLEVIFNKNHLKFYIDVERRKIWTYGKFLFDTINIPMRKKNMMENRTPFFYYMFRNDCKKFIIIEGVQILKSKLVASKNMYATDEELFFSVPLDNILGYFEIPESVYANREGTENF